MSQTGIREDFIIGELNNMEIKFKLIPSPGGYCPGVPEYESAGAAGMDLRACIDEPVTIEPGQTRLIPAGIALEIPEGYAGFMFGRSGLGVKHGITMANGVGVIDSDYRGQLHSGLINRSDESFTVLPGDRIAQLVIMPVLHVALVSGELSDTERGTSGFGSTGRA